MDLDGQGKEKELAMERKIICALCGKSLEMTETFFDYYGHHLHKDLLPQLWPCLCIQRAGRGEDA
mgnify:CR=1 FL=1